MWDEFTEFREPTAPELRLLEALFRKCADSPSGWLARLRVSPMLDGHMGSLRLRLAGEDEGSATFWRRGAELQFTDSDGVEVIASLNLDTHGKPFELDIWKTNFAPLVQIPERLV